MLEVWCLRADRQPARRAELGARAAAVTLLDAESCSLGPIDGTVNSEQCLAVDARLPYTGA